MTGDEKNMATMVDSAGSLWTVTPSHLLPQHIDVTNHTDEGPHTLTVPTCDAVALASRLRAVAMAEVFDRVDREIDAAEVKPEPAAAMDGPTVARLMGTPEAALANQAGIRAFVETKGTKLEKAEAGMRAWHATYAATNPTPAAPTTDGTCNHGGEGDDDAEHAVGDSGEHYARIGEAS